MAFKLTDFYIKTRQARKIIVLGLGYLGDTLHLVPALWDIRRNYPQAELHVASASVGSELLAMAPCVDRTWPLARGPRGTPWREQWRWLGAVRRERFEVAFNVSGTDRTIFLTFLTGAPWRVAFAGGRRHFWNTWFIRHWVPRVDRSVHVAEQHRRLLAACGLALGPLRYDLKIPEAALRWAEENVPAQAVHLSVNASHSLKEWPLEHWVALAQTVLAEHPEAQIVATGTALAREQERLRQFAATIRNPRLRIFSGGLTQAHLSALLARCRLHVGVDSGALHLAAVLGLPTVSLFRDYEGIEEWLPRGEQHQHVVAPCVCVNQKVQPCLKANRADCLARISVEHVAGLVRARWNTQGLARRGSATLPPL